MPPKNMYVQLTEEDIEPRCIALGDEDNVAIVETEENTPITNTEKIAVIEQRIYELTNSMDSLFTIVKNLRLTVEKNNIENDRKIAEKEIKNKKIPVGVVLTGTTTKKGLCAGITYFLTVREDGFYVGETKYPTLSAAAEAVSGVRRSGWSFWKLENNKSVKEVYKG